MDNRRRSDSRESGRPSMPAEPVAELIEIGPVPQPGRRGVVPAALGLSLFVAGVLAGSSLVRFLPPDVAGATAGPTGGTAGANGSIAASGGPAATRPTPGPTSSPRVTPKPTPVPTDVPWAWTAGAFDNSMGSPFGLWSVGGKLVVHVGFDGNTAFRTSDEGVSWVGNFSSRAISEYLGSTVVDDRLWFVLRIAGLQADHLEIGYPVWAEDGANVSWVTKGRMAGDAPDWVGGFAKVGGTWVMSRLHHLAVGQEGGIDEVWVSNDGVDWSNVHPDGITSLSISRLERMGAKLVAYGSRPDTDNRPVALTTLDGRHWSSRPFPGDVNGGTGIYDLACSADACVAVGSMSGSGPERPAMWATTDGLDWRLVAEDLTGARQDGFISAVVATPEGFIALGSPDREVLLSRDALTWRSTSALRRSDGGTMGLLAVNGSVVFALGQQTSGADGQWRGSLGGLPFP